jgi:hypothetical protein
MNQKCLLIKDGGWEVAVSSWTVAAKPGNQVIVCYMWRQSSLGGVASAGLNLTMDKISRNLEGR